jgi:hypothetical protein
MTIPSGILVAVLGRKKINLPEIVAFLSLLSWSHALHLDQYLGVRRDLVFLPEDQFFSFPICLQRNMNAPVRFERNLEKYGKQCY